MRPAKNAPWKKRFLIATMLSLVTWEGVAAAVPDFKGPSLVREIAFIVAESSWLARAVADRGPDGIKYRDGDGMRRFYESRGYKPFWTDEKSMSPKAGQAIKVLEQSWTHGLNPGAYHLARLKQLSESRTAESMQGFEVLLTDAVIRYAKDMTGMRVSPATIKADPHSWRRGLDGADIMEYLSRQTNMTQALKKFDPPGRLYGLMREALVDLLEHGDITDRTQAVNVTGTIYPGDINPQIIPIARRLGINQDTDMYDQRLLQAVSAFQDRNGLKPDGIIGRRTIAALNKSQHDRYIQLISNMERIRWLDPRLPEKYIVVNIPAMTLWAIQDGRVKHEMAVIVGRPKRPTQSFIADIKGIRFNPSWTVPDTIKAKDFLPALQKDPRALEKKGIFFIKGSGKDAREISPDSVDWASVTQSDLRNIRMVQPPGDDNALGQIRVLMPNDYNIYLHDTNTPELFIRDDRAQSSGCVRVSEPETIANFILSGNEGWSEEKLQSMLAKSGTRETAAAQQIPVYILYQTVWLHTDGGLVYGDDVYDEDAKLFQALGKINGVPATPFTNIETDQKQSKSRASQNL